MIIRDIEKKDYERVLEIYNWYILNSPYTLENEPHTLEGFSARIDSIREKFPYIVCEDEGRVIGYAYLDPFGPRWGYRFTSDLAIYVDKDSLSCGAGRMLMEGLLSRADEMEIRDVIAVVTDENPGSIAFHEKMGFEIQGRFKGIADKFGRRFGVAYMQKTIK